MWISEIGAYCVVLGHSASVAAGDCRVGFLRKRFESIMKDKSSKLQLLSGTDQFRKRTDKLLSWFLGMFCYFSVCYNVHLFILICCVFVLHICFSALTLLVGWQEGHPASPDGMAPSRIVGVSVSVNLPLHHKVQKFSSGTGCPEWSRKKGRKTVVVLCLQCLLYSADVF